MPVEILPEGHYRSYLGPCEESGIEPSHVASVAFRDGISRRAYVKLYPEHSRGLVNEVTGYILAKALGLAVPDRAAVILMPRNAIPDPPDWLSPSESLVPAWCTQAIDGKSIKFIYSLTMDNLDARIGPIVNELLRSTDTVDVLAYDDWVANVDRNLGNLLRLGRCRFAVIDHGQILSGPIWRREDLKAADPYKNVLRTLLKKQATDPMFQAKILQASAAHSGALTSALTALVEWWDILLTPEDKAAALQFLELRASEEYARKRSGLML